MFYNPGKAEDELPYLLLDRNGTENEINGIDGYS
jgi:hypothetical protein